MKTIFFILSLLLFGLVVQSQNISPLIIAMPDDMLNGVALDQRKLLITPENDSSQVEIVNAMGDTIKRIGFSDDFIALQTSKIGTLQIKLLPLVNNSQIVGVITTVCGPVCDSHIDFYATDWKPLNQSNLFPEINKNNFLKDDIDRESEAFKNAAAVLDMTPIKLNFSATDKNITVVYDIRKYLSKEDYESLLPFLKEKPLTYTWDKFGYK